MKKIILVLLLTVYSFAASTFNDPQPTFDEPRKVVFQLLDSDLNKVNHNLGSIYNILKEYPSESLKVVVVVYGNGMRALKKDYDTNTLKRISSLMEYDVEFIGCKNTMKTMNWVEDDFIDDIEFVQAGIVELIERQVDGYIGIRAY
jgi:intracellular sulfur oxidation DsrE/DsrF family protein